MAGLLPFPLTRTAVSFLQHPAEGHQADQVKGSQGLVPHSLPERRTLAVHILLVVLGFPHLGLRKQAVQAFRIVLALALLAVLGSHIHLLPFAVAGLDMEIQLAVHLLVEHYHQRRIRKPVQRILSSSCHQRARQQELDLAVHLRDWALPLGMEKPCFAGRISLAHSSGRGW